MKITKIEKRHHLSKNEVIALKEAFKANYQSNYQKAKEILGVEAFTFSFDEIDAFGEKYRELYQNPEKLGLTFDELLDVFTVYYGESIFHYFGGYFVYTTDKVMSSYGFPVVADYGPKGEGWPEWVPATYAGILIREYEIKDLDIEGKQYKLLSWLHKVKIKRYKDEGYSLPEMKRLEPEMSDKERDKEFGKNAL